MKEQNELQFKTIPLLDSERGQALVRQICESENLPQDVFWELVKAELAQVGKQRKRGLGDLFDTALDKSE